DVRNAERNVRYTAAAANARKKRVAERRSRHGRVFIYMAALRAVDGIKWGMEKKARVRDQRTKKLVWCAMLAALTCVSTAWISFPIGMIPGAYIHAGDAVIYLAAYLLGPLPGAIVGAIGSAGAD